MNKSNQPENKNPTTAHDLGQISTGNSTPGTREHVEMILDTLKGANMAPTVKALNGITRGSYIVKISTNAEYNEAQVRLYDTPGRTPIATGYIDRGHTMQSKREAAEELRGLARAYLCR